jgi:hypothetical protein
MPARLRWEDYQGISGYSQKRLHPESVVILFRNYIDFPDVTCFMTEGNNSVEPTPPLFWRDKDYRIKLRADG